MDIIKFDVKDKIQMKKNHPCGYNIFTVLRGGTDVRIICDRCGRDMSIERTSLEKKIKKVIKTDD